jgi:hypothetical protein
VTIKKKRDVRREGYATRGKAVDTSSLKVWERDKKIAGKMTVATRYLSIVLIFNFSFGEARQIRKSSCVICDNHPDESQNHTFTIKYKTRSFLQMIGRIPKTQEIVADGIVQDEINLVKIESEKDEGELNIVDGVIVID